MTTEFDRSEEGRQKRTIEESQGVYSDTLVDRLRNPKNMGRLAKPDAYGIACGWCGDTMEIYLRLTGGRVEEARFMTDGCGPTVACGSMLSSMVEGLSAEEAKRIKPTDLIEALGGLPQENTHCAKLAVDTLLKAILRASKTGML
ncbi:iron-sulfur cluster assembly scaffold protein [Candidatus Bipolaricaulota bacterium]